MVLGMVEPEETVDIMCPPIQERTRVITLLTQFATVAPFMHGYVLRRATSALEEVIHVMREGGEEAVGGLLGKKDLRSNHIREGFLLAGMIAHYGDWVLTEALPESVALQQAQEQFATYSGPLFQSLDQAQMAFLHERLVAPLVLEQSVNHQVQVRRNMLH